MDKKELINLLNNRMKKIEDVNINERENLTTYSTVYFKKNEEIAKDFLVISDKLTIISNDIPKHLLVDLLEALPQPKREIPSLIFEDNFDLIGENTGVVKNENMNILFLDTCILLQGEDYDYILDFFLTDLKLALDLQEKMELVA